MRIRSATPKASAPAASYQHIGFYGFDFTFFQVHLIPHFFHALLPEIHSNNSVLWHGNTKRLEIWASVGADVENGLWSVYGTRLGAFMTNMVDWDHEAIADYDWFDVFWKDEIGPKFQSNKLNVDMDMYCPYTKYKWSYELLWDETCRLGHPLRRSMGFNVGDLDEDASRFFKHVYVAPSRTGYD